MVLNGYRSLEVIVHSIRSTRGEEEPGNEGERTSQMQSSGKKKKQTTAQVEGSAFERIAIAFP